MKNNLVLLAFLFITILTACKKDKKQAQPEATLNTMPAFYNERLAEEYGKIAPIYTLIASASEKVSSPWDIDFHPFRKNELWVLNKGTESTGGSTVTISNVGMSNQNSEFRKDGNSWHFMALPSAISFSRENGNWATTAEIQDANRRGGSFTGPSLWSSDMNVYAKPSNGNGSHLDMLHGSPYSMGIEADRNNSFWVFDGYYGHIVWYDFSADHGPGNANHDDGRVHRYTELPVSRSAGIPSHMVLHKPSSWLYIADPSNGRILRMNTKSGVKNRNLNLINEQLAEHWEMKNLEWNVFVTAGLKKPAGIEVIGDILYVSDYETGEIIAFSISTSEELGRINTGKSKVMGIKADPSGKLYFVANGSNEIYRIDPQ